MVVIDSGADAVTEPMAAVIVVDPRATPVMMPVVGPTVAMDVALELQLALVDTFIVVPSEYVPVAVSCRDSPIPEEAGLGVIAIDSTTADVTVKVAVPDTEPELAVMTADPGATAVTRPEVAFTLAMAGALEVQVTVLVKSRVLVSLKVPVAVNCCASPLARLGVVGVIAIRSEERRVGKECQ